MQIMWVTLEKTLPEHPNYPKHPRPIKNIFNKISKQMDYISEMPKCLWQAMHWNTHNIVIKAQGNTIEKQYASHHWITLLNTGVWHGDRRPTAVYVYDGVCGPAHPQVCRYWWWWGACSVANPSILHSWFTLKNIRHCANLGPPYLLLPIPTST